ncbi:hypothetical protein HZS_8045 [Henneguya salminicola]|nr:hypothetical protein HZS_8045 [Henneguya salminicola]
MPWVLLIFGNISIRIARTIDAQDSLRNGRAKLIVEGNNFTIKWLPTCQILINTIASSSQNASKSYSIYFVYERISQLELYPHKINEPLSLSLKQNVDSNLYELSSKKGCIVKNKTGHGSRARGRIQAVVMPSFKNSQQREFILQRYWCRDIHSKYRHMLIWIPTECLSLLRYNGHAFIDDTFKSTLAPSGKCMIILTFDRETLKYIPCFYSLRTAKVNAFVVTSCLNKLYCANALGYPFIPVDFEKSLISAIRNEIPQSSILG